MTTIANTTYLKWNDLEFIYCASCDDYTSHILDKILTEEKKDTENQVDKQVKAYCYKCTVCDCDKIIEF